MRMALILGALIATAIVGLLHVDDINRWERDHGYPYGRMCDLTNSCPVR